MARMVLVIASEDVGEPALHPVAPSERNQTASIVHFTRKIGRPNIIVNFFLLSYSSKRRPLTWTTH